MYQRLLIANRGEIAVRIARAAAGLGIESVMVYSEDDAAAAHLRHAHSVVPLRGRGPRAYLDAAQLIEIARTQACDAVHPGYGFLSEHADFAAACVAAGLLFVGPEVATLQALGDKAAARALAQSCGVAIPRGLNHAATLDEISAFFSSLPPGTAMLIKALAGGGGRGMRVVHAREEIAAAYARCRDEAQAAFGDGAVYAEELLTGARHVEVQIVGDGRGGVSHLYERECTLQRRHQKLIELAPSPSLDGVLREALCAASVRLAQALRYRGLGTFEFLVRADETGGVAEAAAPRFVFIEANPRLQVEHTVTEEVLGLDLVAAQLRIAAGADLGALALQQHEIPAPRGHALQVRINAETLDAEGGVHAAAGQLQVFEVPTGPGIRVDTALRSGDSINPAFDSLLAKLIVHVRRGSYRDAVQAAARALAEFHIAGVAHSAAFARALLQEPAVLANRIDTAFVGAHLPGLLAAARVYTAQSAEAADATAELAESDDVSEWTIVAPMAGLVSALAADIDTVLAPGQPLLFIEAMKMEHPVPAPVPSVVRKILVAPGRIVAQGQVLAVLARVEQDAEAAVGAPPLDFDTVNAALAEVRARHALTLDEARPEATAKRHAQGSRTARENVADLLDPGSFIEYGALTFAAQRRQRSVEELMRSSPADGLVAGLGTVNAQHVGAEAARCAVMAYDYTVFAGTQGINNHRKMDRLLHLAEQRRLPVVLFAEGGGGRPSDTDGMGAAYLDTPTFSRLARLSAWVPTVAVVHGRCFAGNAALAGCCDVLIATADASIGMAGPAMIEGGGLGRVRAEDIGPVSMQAPNGVIDLVVDDEAAAVQAAQGYLSYFQGPRKQASAADPRELRHIVPELRKRAYDMRHLIRLLCDSDSVLELRAAFAPALITALVRVEGRSFGLIANDPGVLGGALDAAAGDKAARFMQLCDAYDLPMISLCDTPGFMVGPEAERAGTVRHVARMFVTAASLSVPFFTVVIRKAYGLGAQAMAAGSFHEPVFTIAWPTAEFGAMGPEGAVRLALAKDLSALDDADERRAVYERALAQVYRAGRAVNVASSLEIDAVIDPAETRQWLLRGVAAMPAPPLRHVRKRPFIDTW